MVLIKSLRSILAFSLVVVLFGTFFPVDPVHALSRSSRNAGFPPLDTFVSQVKNGQAGELRGIYIPEILAAPVIQQPAGNHEFVSPRQNVLTQFNLASQFGTTGLLAHNYLAGESFSLLQKDQKFYLIHGDGQVSSYVVKDVLRYEALEPDSTLSSFVNLESSDLFTAAELFSQVYARPGNVILQTCISRDNNLSWGRLFVIAEPSSSGP